MVSQSLPIVDAYAHDTLEKCQTGACSNCGLCCTTMETHVPSEHGNIDSAPMLKRAGVVCPQLIRTNRGRYLCALHEHVQAGDERVANCAAWSGEGNGLLQLTVQTEGWIAAPPNTPAAEMIADLVRLKLLSRFCTRLPDADAVEVARRYIMQLRVCPDEVFDLLGVRSAFRNMFAEGRSAYFQFDRELWETSPTLYTHFFERYVWGGSGPYAQQQRRDISGP